MSQVLRRRTEGTVVAVALVAFFGLVAYVLGPIALKQRTENVFWYGLHIIGGSLVLGLGPFQFVAALHNRFRGYHRIAGFTYIAASLAAVVGYVGLPKNDLFMASQSVALILWILCALFAFVSIRNGNIQAHQHNMARSFVLAAYFLTARLIDKHGMWLLTPVASSEDVRLVHSDWLAWVVPLLVLEVFFSMKKRERS